MNPTPVILLSVALAAGASVATTYALRPEPKKVEAADAIVPDALESLKAQVASLNTELERLRAERSSSELPLATSRDRVQMDAIDEAVQRYFEGRTVAGLVPEETEETSVAASEDASRTVDEWYELLNDPGLEGDARQAVWDRIRENGMLDDTIAMLEARADKFSDDPEAQVEVASAYIQKIFEVGEGPAAGLWAGKADKAFDRALALDDRHWDARFNKAISLSFWPPIFGKQREAISHFETLIEQQVGGPSEDRHAQTYLLLGNLYAQSGDSSKAETTWKAGLGLFPDNESLIGKFGGQ